MNIAECVECNRSTFSALESDGVSQVTSTKIAHRVKGGWCPNVFRLGCCGGWYSFLWKNWYESGDSGNLNEDEMPVDIVLVRIV